MALFVTFLLGLFFPAGMLIVKNIRNTKAIEDWSIAIAFGAMIALVALDLGPEAYETTETLGIWLTVILAAAGFAVLKLLDHFIPEHNDYDDEEEGENLAHIGLITSVAIILHNIVEGMGVYSVLSGSVSGGISLMIGVGLHNIPMGMLIYTTLKEEGKGKRYTVMVLTALSTFIGGLIIALLSPILSAGFEAALVCLALGMVLYILILELFPSVRHCRDRRSVIFGTAAGFAIVLIGAVVL